MQLAGLFLVGDKLQVHSAHEFKTCFEHFLRVVSLIEQSPHLERRVLRIRRGAGEQAIELRTGERLRFVARSAGSGRGLSADRVYLDEAFALTPTIMGALIPTLSARANPQVVYTSSAPREESDVLHGLCRRGRAGQGDRLLYAEWAASPDDDHKSLETWARANPGFPYRIGPEAIEMESAALDAKEFARERLGISDRGGAPASGIDLARWDALAGDFDLGPGASLAVDVDEEGARGTVVAAGLVGDSVCLEVVAEGGIGALVDWIARQDRRAFARVVLDGGSQAQIVATLLAAASVEVVRMKAPEVFSAEAMLVDAVGTSSLRHRGDGRLRHAILAAEQVVSGERWRWSRRRSTGDITPLIAAALAVAAARSPETAVFAY